MSAMADLLYPSACLCTMVETNGFLNFKHSMAFTGLKDENTNTIAITISNQHKLKFVIREKLHTKSLAALSCYTVCITWCCSLKPNKPITTLLPPCNYITCNLLVNSKRPMVLTDSMLTHRSPN